MTPKLLAIPFAKDGNKNTIQDERQPAQDANEATWSGGFPPVTMQAKTDGGLPPQGLDFNGIFHDVSSHTVYSCMGGQYKFSAEYAEKIGGYPKGAILLNDEENRRYISTNDKNKSNFNEPKFTGWLVISIADIDTLLDAKADNTDIAESLNKKADKDINVKAGSGLSGGGTLEATRTITLGTPSTITENSKNTVTSTSHTHEIQKATTSQSGIVQLTNNIDDSEDKAITPRAVDKLRKEMFDAMPVGVIVSWDHAVAPKNWLFVRDQKFSATEYPELAKLYPSLTLNDRRGTVDRALDSGRGFDTSRELGSYQADAMQKMTGVISNVFTDYIGNSTSESGIYYGPTGGLEGSFGDGSNRRVRNVFLDSSRSARTANETRMKNVATNKIIKAK